MSRPVRIRARGAAWRLALVLLAAGLGAGEAVALSLSGAVLPSATVSAAGLVAGGTQLPWAEVALLATATPPATAISGGVVTSRGEILRGQAGDLEAGQLRCSSDRLGRREVPLDGLAAVILAPLEFAALPRLLAGPAGAILGNGERVAGTLSFLNTEAVGIDTGRRSRRRSRAPGCSSPAATASSSKVPSRSRPQR